MIRPPQAQLITGEDAASVCGVQPATIRDWVRRGILPRYGTPRRSLYAWADLAYCLDAAKPRRVSEVDRTQSADHAHSVTTGRLTA